MSGLDFETFQGKLVEGELAACFVTYVATIVDCGTDEVVGTAKVVAEKDELIDFNSAVTDEACQPIADEIEENLPDDQEVSHLDVKFIMNKLVNNDGSVTYVTFTPDGRSFIVNLSAKEAFEETLAALFE